MEWQSTKGEDSVRELMEPVIYPVIRPSPNNKMN